MNGPYKSFCSCTCVQLISEAGCCLPSAVGSSSLALSLLLPPACIHKGTSCVLQTLPAGAAP